MYSQEFKYFFYFTKQKEGEWRNGQKGKPKYEVKMVFFTFPAYQLHHFHKKCRAIVLVTSIAQFFAASLMKSDASDVHVGLLMVSTPSVRVSLWSMA